MEAALNAIGGGNLIITAPAAQRRRRSRNTRRTFGSYFRKGDGDELCAKPIAQASAQPFRRSMSVSARRQRRLSRAGRMGPQDQRSAARDLADASARDGAGHERRRIHDALEHRCVGLRLGRRDAARPQTTTASLAPITFASGEIYAMPAATQRLLDDAAINVEDWLRNSVQKEFNRQEGIAFLVGRRREQARWPPDLRHGRGERGRSSGRSDRGVDHATRSCRHGGDDRWAHRLHVRRWTAPYRQNATWLMSSLTAAVLAKLKDANGNLIWRESLIVGQPSTLFGRPVEIDEGCRRPRLATCRSPSVTSKRATSSMIGSGTRVLRDPYTNKPYRDVLRHEARWRGRARSERDPGGKGRGLNTTNGEPVAAPLLLQRSRLATLRSWRESKSWLQEQQGRMACSS